MGYDVVYTAPKNERFTGMQANPALPGSMVTVWMTRNSHNSYSRVAREWGEEPQIRQASTMPARDYGGSLTVDQFYKISSGGHIGGALWHRLTTSVVIILTLSGED